MSERLLLIPTAEAQQALGGAVAEAVRAARIEQTFIIYLRGELGVGKTTWVRGFIRGFGYHGRVPSPTYTLIESYEFGQRQLYHLDLYRLADAEELEWLGLRDLLEADAVALIEWPERGEGVLPAPDLEIDITYQAPARRIRLTARSESGRQVLHCLAA